MKLLYYPDESLNTYCQKVEVFDKDLWEKIDGMKKIMEEHDGMGLAANQVGLTDRMFIMKDLKGKIWEFINPVIIYEDDVQYEPEGCLSFPGTTVSIKRSKQVSLVAQDSMGEHFNVGAYGKEAVCIQHEIEHLDGITFLNSLSRQQKRDVLRKVKK